jgi:hypothetical protein
MYGIDTLLVRPIRTLYGASQLLGSGRLFCNITNASSSLQIELVSYFLLIIVSFDPNFSAVILICVVKSIGQ